MTRQTRGEVAQSLLSDIRRFIGNNYSYDVRFDDYLDGIGDEFDRRQVQRLLRCIGTSWREELIGYRMKKAREMLRSSDLAIVTIAEDVGYRDSAYFSKEFRKHNSDGMSPVQYRRAAREQRIAT